MTKRFVNDDRFISMIIYTADIMQKNFDQTRGQLDVDTRITYCRYISGLFCDEEFMIYETGKKYCIGSYKQSSNRKKYLVHEIPAKYISQFNDLRTFYDEQMSYNSLIKKAISGDIDDISCIPDNSITDIYLIRQIAIRSIETQSDELLSKIKSGYEHYGLYPH